MKSLIMIVALTMTPAISFAGETCENFAKYFAIRDYKAQGPVQGSEGIQYESEMISVDTYADREEYLYTVAISDNNEDGEYWTVNYELLLEKTPNNPKCRLLSIKSDVIGEKE